MTTPEGQRSTAEFPQWQSDLNQAVADKLGQAPPSVIPFSGDSVRATCVRTESPDRAIFFLLEGDIMSATSAYSQPPVYAIEEIMPANPARFAVSASGEYADPSPGWRKRYEAFDEAGGRTTYFIDPDGIPQLLGETKGGQLAAAFGNSTQVGKREFFYTARDGNEGIHLLAQIIEAKVAEVSGQR